MVDVLIEERGLRVDLRPVEGRISVVHPTHHGDDDSRWAVEEGDSRSIRRRSSALRSKVAFDLQPRSLDRAMVEIAVVVAMVTLVGRDPGFGLTVGLVVALIALVRTLDRGIGYSFGEGFLGYRPNDAWPQGVQEDDDVRWDWRSRHQDLDRPIAAGGPIRPSAAPR